MLLAAKEKMLSSFVPWCAETCISAHESRGKKPHQGVATKKSALFLGHELSNSTTALGLRGQAALNRIGSRCTGKERDAETGLDYFGKRYYGSALGRFTSADPIHIKFNRLLDPQRLNLYVYARNNPLAFIDPDGADAVKVVEKTYQVTGANVGEAWQNAKSQNPNSGKARGETDWGSFHATYKTKWTSHASGGKTTAKDTVTDAHVTTDVTVTTPTWTGKDQAPADQQQQWDSLVGGLKDHEQGHVEIVQKNVDQVQNDLNGTTGQGTGQTQKDALNQADQNTQTNVNNKLSDAENKTQQQSDAYDERTKHGEIPRNQQQ